jgi:hypothetical protein
MVLSDATTATEDEEEEEEQEKEQQEEEEEEEEKKPTPFKKKRKCGIGRKRKPLSRQKRVRGVSPVGLSGVSPGVAAGVAAAANKSSREPLQMVSPNFPSPKPVKPNSRKNLKSPPPQRIGQSPEELGEAFGISLLAYMKTDEETTAAGNAFMDIVTMQFMAEEHGNRENPVSMLSPVVIQRVQELPNTPTIDVTKKAFYINPSTGETRKGSTARMAKKRSVEGVEIVLDKIGTPAQQALALATVLQKPERQAVGKALGVVISTDMTRRVADGCLNSLKEVLHHPAVKGKQTKDALTFQQTVLWAVSPAAAPDDATPQEKRVVRKAIKETAAALGMSKSRPFVKRLTNAAIVRRDNFLNPEAATLVCHYTRGSFTRFTPEFIVEIRNWLVHHCTKLIDSPNSKDSVMVKCPITGVKKKERKQYYMFSIREIHNELIKPANEGGFAGAYNDERIFHELRNLKSRCVDARSVLTGTVSCWLTIRGEHGRRHIGLIK